MPWRLIGLIAVLVVLLGFIGVNLGNICTISFGFAVLNDVPVYVVAFASFVLGMLASVPFLVSFALKKKGTKFPKSGGDGAQAEPLE